MKIKSILILGVITCAIYSCNQSKKSNEISERTSATIFYNGDIITMVGDAPQYVEALVQREGQIVFVGDKATALQKFDGKAKRLNLEGKTMLPGFIDGHAHFSFFATQAIGAQILPPPDAGAKDIPTLINILKEWNTPENRD